MKINEEEIKKLARFEALEIVHSISNVICNEMANEDKALMIERILESIKIIG